MSLTTDQRMRLCVETAISLPTVVKWDKGVKIREANRRLLELTARRLGFPVSDATSEAKDRQSAS